MADIPNVQNFRSIKVSVRRERCFTDFPVIHDQSDELVRNNTERLYFADRSKIRRVFLEFFVLLIVFQFFLIFTSIFDGKL